MQILIIEGDLYVGVAFNVVQGMCAKMYVYTYKRNIVYSIPCQQCPNKYVGQTGSGHKKI